MRRFYLWLAAIAVAGVAVRVVYTLAVAPWPPSGFGDELYYSLLAKLIATGHGFVSPAELLGQGEGIPTAHRPPLYPVLLSGLAELGGTGANAQRLVGSLTGGGTIVVAGLLGRRLATPRAGLLAAAVAAAYPTLIAADGALMTEALYGLLSGIALIAAYRLSEQPSLGRAAVLGAVIGLAALTRGEALLLLPLVLVPVVRRPGGLRAAAVACLVFVVVLAPWTIRNWSTFDRPVLLATEAGETIGGANCESTYYGASLGAWDVFCVHQPPTGNEAERLDTIGREGRDYALDHLGRVPVVLAARFGRTWSLYHPFATPEGRSHALTVAGVLAFALLLPLAVYGLVLLRRRDVPVWILLTPFATVTLTALVAYGALRFRQSAELPLVVLAAVAVDRLFDARRAA